jgi:hypothetical protein
VLVCLSNPTKWGVGIKKPANYLVKVGWFLEVFKANLFLSWANHPQSEVRAVSNQKGTP